MPSFLYVPRSSEKKAAVLKDLERPTSEGGEKRGECRLHRPDQDEFHIVERKRKITF